ncbi:MAG: hypothetical protein IJT70_06965 [Clostridia bacterium]|nr:hypothetical protein [Clostridia bacterium]
MKLKKIIAVLLVACMALAVLASCEEDGGAIKKPDGQGNDIDNQFPAGDYNGEDFGFLTFTSKVDSSGTEYYTGEWIDCDSITGVATQESVYRRNLLCEQKYNVKISNKTEEGGYEELNTYYQMGDFTFDVIYGWANRMAVGITENGFHDFRDLHNKGFINLNASYWDENANNALTVAGRTYLAINDITMSKVAWTGCLFFNPILIEKFGLTEDNPHNLVAKDEWTVDKFLEMVQKVHDELNGDNQFTKDDCYGLVDLGTTQSLLYGCGVELVDSDYRLAIGEEKVINLIGKIYNVLSNRQYVFDYDTIVEGFTQENPWAYTRSFFANGHALFVGGTPELTREFKEMENGYGVVPLPKYNNTQTEYTAAIDPCAGIFALPYNEVRIDGVDSSYERTGKILEYLAYKSSEEGNDESVLNTYYETTIKGQRQTIEENKNMLDMIKKCGHYQWAAIFNVGGILGSQQDNSIAGVLGQMASKGSGVQSTFKRSQTRLQKAIDDLFDQISALPVE